MDSFLFCLILVTVIAMGGRDQLIVGQLSDRLAARRNGELRRPIPVLMLGVGGAVLTAGAMTYAGMTMSEILPQRAAQMLVAFALAIAAFELAWPVRVKSVEEPTQSLFAVGAVLLWRQFGDAARFAIFAFAAEATYPITALIGGALGGAASITLGWSLGYKGLSKFPLRYLRLALAIPMIVAAIFIGLNARYATG